MDFSLTEEQNALIQTARDFTRKEIIPVAAHHDETGEFPRDILKRAWETGLMNIEIPEAYGGLGGSCLDNCLVQEEVAFGCTGFNTTMAGNNLGAMPILVPSPEVLGDGAAAALLAASRRGAHVLITGAVEDD